MIEHFENIAMKHGFYLNLDWIHTKQTIPYLKYCHTIVSIGRIKWIPDGKKLVKIIVAGINLCRI